MLAYVAKNNTITKQKNRIITCRRFVVCSAVQLVSGSPGLVLEQGAEQHAGVSWQAVWTQHRITQTLVVVDGRVVD